MAAKELIQRIELSVSAASITFSNIPQTFTDLYLVTSLRISQNNNNTWTNARITLNSATSGYTERLLYGQNGSVASASGTGNPYFNYQYTSTDIATASTFSNSKIYIPNYTGNQYKSLSVDSVTEHNGSDAIQAITAMLWSNTSAITSLSILPSTGQFVQHSSASLYGFNKGTDGTTTVS